MIHTLFLVMLRLCAVVVARPKRLLVFVNPFGGRRQAPKVWQQVAAPVLAAVGTQCEVVETTYQASPLQQQYHQLPACGVTLVVLCSMCLNCCLHMFSRRAR
jgi:hypothetical protein